MVRGILNDQLLLKIQSIYKKFMFWLKLNLEIKREPIPPPPPTHIPHPCWIKVFIHANVDKG